MMGSEEEAVTCIMGETQALSLGLVRLPVHLIFLYALFLWQRAVIGGRVIHTPPNVKELNNN